MHIHYNAEILMLEIRKALKSEQGDQFRFKKKIDHFSINNISALPVQCDQRCILSCFPVQLLWLSSAFSASRYLSPTIEQNVLRKKLHMLLKIKTRDKYKQDWFRDCCKTGL